MTSKSVRQTSLCHKIWGPGEKGDILQRKVAMLYAVVFFFLTLVVKEACVVQLLKTHIFSDTLSQPQADASHRLRISQYIRQVKAKNGESSSGCIWVQRLINKQHNWQRYPPETCFILHDPVAYWTRHEAVTLSACHRQLVCSVHLLRNRWSLP